MTRIRKRLPEEVFEEVFRLVLQLPDAAVVKKVVSGAADLVEDMFQSQASKRCSNMALS